MSEQITAEMISRYMEEHSPEEIRAELPEKGFELPAGADRELSPDEPGAVSGGGITKKVSNASIGALH